MISCHVIKELAQEKGVSFGHFDFEDLRLGDFGGKRLENSKK